MKVIYVFEDTRQQFNGDPVAVPQIGSTMFNSDEEIPTVYEVTRVEQSFSIESSGEGLFIVDRIIYLAPIQAPELDKPGEFTAPWDRSTRGRK